MLTSSGKSAGNAALVVHTGSTEVATRSDVAPNAAARLFHRSGSSVLRGS